MKSKTALILVLLLVACLAFLLVKNTGLFRSPAPTKEAAGKGPVFEKAPQGVAKVVIAPAEGARLVLIRQDADWRIEEPLRAKADTFKVNSLIDAVAQLKSSKSFRPDDKDAVPTKVTSLEAPLWTVELSDAKGAVWRLAVGKPVPLRPGETYVQPEGQKRAYAALADLAETLRRPAREYRDKTVLRFSATEAVALGLSGREVRGAYELEKRKDDWGIVKPFSARADKDAVHDILGDLSFLSAVNFVSDEPTGLAGYGLEEGKERLVVRVSVQAEANAPRPAATSSAPATASAPASAPTSGPAPKVYAVAFGERTDDKVYARIPGEPTIFQLNASVLDGILKKLEGIRRATVLEFDPATVSAIELNLPDGNAVLTRQDAEWRLTQPLAGKANLRAVFDLFGRLTVLKAQSWVDARAVSAATGLEKPFATIKLSLAGKGETLSLLIGASLSSGETYVKSGSGTSIALVKTSDTMPLVFSAATYWEAFLYSLPADMRPTKLVIARRDNTFTLVSEEGAWKLATPVQAPADGPQVAKILRDLSNLTAEKVVYLGNEVPEQYAKAVHNLTVEVSGRKPLEQAGSRPATQPTSAASGPATASATAEAPPAVMTSAPAGSSAPATAAAELTTAPASQPATGPAMGPETPAGKLQFAKVEDRTYAWLPGQKPLAIGEFPGSLYDDVAAELRQRSVWHVEPNEVVGVKLVSGPERLDLRREGEDWVNVLNPDEKVDAEKVRTFLGDVKDISAERFMTYQASPADVEKLGLQQPWATLEMRLSGGKSLVLTVSARGQDKTENRYASGGAVEGVFTLPAETLGKLAKKLSDFKKSAPKPPEPVQ